MTIPPLAPFLRSYPWKLHLLGLLPVVLLLAYLSVFVGTGNALTEFFIEYRVDRPSLNHTMNLITNLTGPFFYGIYGWILVNAVMVEDRKLMKFIAIYVFVEIVITVGLLQVIKTGIGKPRPMEVLNGQGYQPFSSDYGQHSFPSAHTTDVVGSALALLKYRRRLIYALAFGTIIAILGFSRIYLGLHHISDIFGGLLFGSLVAILVNYLSLWQWQAARQPEQA